MTLHPIKVVVLFATAMAALFASIGATPALAQDVPNVISPLRVEPDGNGVNIADGKTTVTGPTLSVPGAPRLVFDKVGNAAPYIVTKVQQGSLGTVRVQQESLHLGEAASESFRCSDYVCDSVTSSGSMLTVFAPGNASFTQAGTGTQYAFTLKHVNSGTTNITQQYYASSITYADGEVLTFTYDTATLAGDTMNRTFYRPNRVSSNTGHYITITYQGSDFNADPTAWSTVAQATIYNASAPSTPLGQLTYNSTSTTITEIGGRVYQCTGCGNALGIKTETTVGSVQLPGEASSAKVIAQTGSTELVASVTNDGVPWTYSYTAPVFDATVNGYHYSAVNVAGPNGYAATYNLMVSDKQNLITSMTDALGRTSSFTYDGPRVTQITAPEGNKIQVAYDDYGNIVQKTTVAKPGSGLASLVETTQQILIGSNCVKVMCYRPAWFRDAKGNQTDFLYNSRGQIIERTDPADAAGVRRKTYTTYDGTSGISRPIVHRVCGNGTTCSTTSEYRTETDYWGNTLLPLAVRKIDAVQSVTLQTTFTYDLAGRLLSADGPLPGSDDAVYTRYDVYGRKTWEIGPLGVNGKRAAKRTTYRDSDDRVTLVESGYVVTPADTALTVVTTQSASYDAHRNAVRTAVAASGTTYQVADASYSDRGQVICQTVRMNPAVFGSLPSDACTAGTAGSQGADRITKILYDATGQQVQVRKGVGTVLEQAYTTTSFTANGKQEYMVDANGNRAKFEYDGFDRQTKWIFPATVLPTAFDFSTPTSALASAGSANAADYEQLTYDANANVTQRRLRDGSTIAFTFDNLNRQTSRTPSGEMVVNYVYDLVGNVIQVQRPGDGVNTTRSYDALGRLMMEWQAFGSAAYQYDSASRMTRLTWADGFYVTYDYDAAGNVTAIRENGAASGIGVLATYSYDNLGRRTGITRGNGTSTSYAFDPVSRLTSTTQDLAGTASDQTIGSMTYNAASQIQSQVRSNDAYAWTGSYNVDRGYTVNGLNQLTTSGATALGYDGRGNLTSSGTSAYTYDKLNELKTAPGVSMYYDPGGRLLEYDTSVSTRFYYAGQSMIAEVDNPSSAILRRYVPGPGTDEPVVWYESSGTSDRRWLHADERGSVIAVSDGSGAMVAVNRYDEYGIPQSTNVGRFQYTGQVWLQELGMYYYKARIYSPTLGRFMQTDPIGYKDQVNLYAYVANDPVNGTDSTGTCTGSRFSDPDGGCKGGGFVEGAGTCSGDCASTRDKANAALNSAFNQAKKAAAGDDPCASKPLCGGHMSRELGRVIVALFDNDEFRSKLVESWVKSNADADANKERKNEQAFWSDYRNGKVKVGILFSGWGNRISYSDAEWHRYGYNVFLHTHPFTTSEGGIQEFSQADLANLRSMHSVGLVMSHNGIYVYDGR